MQETVEYCDSVKTKDKKSKDLKQYKRQGTVKRERQETVVYCDRDKTREKNTLKT